MVENWLTQDETEDKGKPNADIPPEYNLVYCVDADTVSHNTI